MRFNKLDLNLLVALNVLLQERSITRTAAQLNLSPSAVSNALARLRDYFEDELLVQIGRKMEITPRAESLHEAVRDVLLRIDSTIASRPAFDPKTADRTFRIFASDYTQLELGPGLMTAVANAGFSGAIEFLPQVSNPARQLERGEADLLIIPTSFKSDEHPHQVIYEEKFVCVVWNESPLAEREFTFDRYVAASHVVMQPAGHENSSFEDWFLKRYGVTRRVAATSYGFAMLPALVVGTKHVATVHQRMAEHSKHLWPVKVLPCPVPIEPMLQCMQWHRYRTLDPGIEWLRRMVEEASERIR